jgi:3-oxoisoapionate decarboxylase
MPQNSASATSPIGTSLGIVTYCFGIAQRAHTEMPDVPNFADPLVFIQQSAAIGANAVQIPFGVLDSPAVRRIRATAEELGVFLESTVALPRSDADLAKIEAELKTLGALGITIVRTVLLPGRRYEQFKSMDEYRDAVASGRKMLAALEPIAKKNGVRLALENHKDQSTEERLALLQDFSSEWIGACLDVGNNIALLEEPVAVARAFAPFTLTVHFKDQGVRNFADGFLLADVPVGAGCIDLKQIITVVREKKPRVRFHLELITRDPLKVPCLRDDYWRTLPEVKAARFAENMKRLKGWSSPQEFPTISILPLADRVKAERANVTESLRYAAEHLGFSA